MSKADRQASYWTELTQIGLYKRNQGKLVRQLTAGAAITAVLLTAWTMSIHLFTDSPQAVQYGVPAVLALVGVWAVYRLVNYPPFADFLIDVEGEMTKVSWPSAGEIKRATVVVLVTMVTLSLVLFLYDLVWLRVLKFIGILQF